MLRRAAPADAPALSALHAEAFPRAWSAPEFAAFIADPAVLVLVAEAGSPLGFLLARAVLDEAEILSFAVAPGTRRRGLGRRLMEAALAELRARGVARVLLEVNATNGPARALYAGLGFTRVSERPAYYDTGGERRPALVLALDLGLAEAS